MKTFTLHRQNDGPDSPIFGRLEDEDNAQVCVTLELPDKGNLPDVSCIPAGVYPAHRYLSPKRGYEVFMLDHVPGRSAIELHIGNTASGTKVDTDGCILLGTTFGVVNGEQGILGSGDAFRAFMARVAGEQTLVLTIHNAAALIV